MQQRAFAYLRVSGKGQIDGDGFARQSDAIKRHAAANGIKITRTFEERGVSGAIDGMDRPQWVEMIGRVMSGNVRVVLIEKLDRLARDLMIQEHIISDLQRRGIALVSVAEPDLCSNDPTRKLMRQIMGAIAEYDKAMIVMKLRSARLRQKAKHGRCEGAKPYGSLPNEAAVLERIKSMRRAGKSLHAVAETLNADEVPPRRGRRWFPNTVARIAARS